MKQNHNIIQRETLARISVLLIFLSVANLQLFAGFRISSVFGDNMVIQRDKVVEIWGKADKNKRITVTFNGQEVKTRSNKNGKWAVSLDPMPHGGPYSMDIKCNDSILRIENI